MWERVLFWVRREAAQRRVYFILFYFFNSVLEGTCKKGNQTRFLFRNREAWGSEARGGGGCSQSGQWTDDSLKSHSTMSSVSSGSFISLKGQGPEGRHAQVVRAGDSKARTITEHLFPINPAPGSAQYNTWALMWKKQLKNATLYHCFW